MIKKNRRILKFTLCILLLAAIIVPVISAFDSSAATYTQVNSCYVTTADTVITSSRYSSSAVTTVPKGTYIYVTCIQGSVGKTAYGVNGSYVHGYINLSTATRRSGEPDSYEEVTKRLEAVQMYHADGDAWMGSYDHYTYLSSDDSGPYFPSSSLSTSGSAGWQCFGFAREIWRALYGENHESAASYYGSKRYNLSYDADMTLVARYERLWDASIDIANIKNVLSKAFPGDFIQGSRATNGGQHSMIVHSVEADGIWLYDANTDNRCGVRIRFCTWEQMYNERTAGISLYRYANYPHPNRPSGGEITSSDVNGNSASSFIVGDRVVFSADIQNADKIAYDVFVYTDSNKTTYEYFAPATSLGNGKFYIDFYSDDKNSNKYKLLNTMLNDGKTRTFFVQYSASNPAGTKYSALKEFTVQVPSLKLPGDNYTLYPEDTVTLTPSLPVNNGAISVTWVSSDYSVAFVESGRITAKNVGTATVTAVLQYKGTGKTIIREYPVKITVKQRVFIIGFDGNGGTPSESSKNVIVDETFGTLPTATRKGYIFNGWYTSPTGGTKIESSTKVALEGNITLYAHWTPSKYSVFFAANDAADAAGNKPVLSTDKITVTYDAAYGNLPVPTWQGHTFIGWCTEDGKWISSSTKVSITETQTLYAQWKITAYSVTFNGNGGTSASPSKDVSYLTEYGTLPTATKTGYTFVGWYTSATGGKKIETYTVYSSASDVTLYARWSANSYIVEFDANGGIVSTANKNVIYDSSYGIMPTPSRKGYSFTGWYTQPEGGKKVTSSDVVAITSTTTLYAHWSLGSYTVSFNANGGESETDNKAVVYLTQYGTLPTPQKTGYTFTGWYTSIVGGTEIKPTTPVNITNNQTLYAHWSVNTYTVSFNTQSSESRFDSIQIVFDTQYGGLPLPHKTGYTFTGWYTAADGGSKVADDTVYKTGSDSVLHARWTPNEYQVTLNINGGDGSDFNKLVFFDAAYGEFPVPNKTGYNFLGWYTSAEAGDAATKIEPEMIYTSPLNSTLYAHWSPKSISVSFDANGGITSGSEMTFVFDSLYGSLPKASRVGYEFITWKTETGVAISAADIVKIPEDGKVIAEWKAMEYKITLESNGGGFIGSDIKTEIKVVYDSAYPDLPTPYKTGYRFIGWKTVDDNHAFTGATVKITETQTVVAEWVPIKSAVKFDVGGGILLSDSKTVVFDSAYGELPVPERVGYRFLGWSTQGGANVTADTLVAIAENHTLKAVWEVNKYNIVFDCVDESIKLEDMTAVYGMEYGLLPIPNRTGYRFINWMDENQNIVSSDDIVNITADQRLTAIWAPISTQISFDSNGAVYVVPPMVVVYDTAFGTLPNVVRPGYVFEGWYFGDSKISAEDVVSFTEEVTLKAKWTAMTFNVFFNHNGGDCDVTQAEYTSDKPYESLPVVTKPGYAFTGWFNNNGELVAEGSAVIPEDGLVFTAQWTPMIYNVQFSIVGAIDESLTMTVEYNTAYDKLPEHHSFGYEFYGWLDADGNKVTTDTIFTTASDVILYADVKMNSFNITFYAEGGKPEYSHMTVYYNDKLGALPETVKMGYMFEGWFTKDGVQVTDNTVMSFTANTTLYAHWVKIEANTAAALDGNDTLATGCGIAVVVDALAIAIGFIIKKRKSSKR